MLQGTERVMYLLLPLLGGGVAHGLCMKYDWLSALRRPIDGGATWRGARLFGPNKTWRGPVAIGLGAAIVFGMQSSFLHRLPAFHAAELFDYGAINGWLFGFAFGFAAMLGELPNSFLKRRCGVAPGAGGSGNLTTSTKYLHRDSRSPFSRGQASRER